MALGKRWKGLGAGVACPLSLQVLEEGEEFVSVVHDRADVRLPRDWVSRARKAGMFVVEGVSIGVQVSDHLGS